MTETDTETATNTEEMGISVGVVSQYVTGCWRIITTLHEIIVSIVYLILVKL